MNPIIYCEEERHHESHLSEPVWFVPVVEKQTTFTFYLFHIFSIFYQDFMQVLFFITMGNNVVRF